jgi:L-fuconate dehydratase
VCFINSCHAHITFPPQGYSDSKITRLTQESLNRGFTHFKMKVGGNRDDDLRRGKLIRGIIDDPANLPASGTLHTRAHLQSKLPHPEEDDKERARHQKRLAQLQLEKDALQSTRKNAGPTGCVLMIDANQVWDVEEAIDWVVGLKEIKPWYRLVPVFALYWNG